MITIRNVKQSLNFWTLNYTFKLEFGILSSRICLEVSVRHEKRCYVIASMTENLICAWSVCSTKLNSPVVLYMPVHLPSLPNYYNWVYVCGCQGNWKRLTGDCHCPGFHGGKAVSDYTDSTLSRLSVGLSDRMLWVQLMVPPVQCSCTVGGCAVHAGLASWELASEHRQHFGSSQSRNKG